MIIPYLLLALVPLFFSHLFAPFGLILGSGSFERVKVLLAFFLVLLGCIEVLIWKNQEFFEWWKWYGKRSVFILGFPLFILGITHMFHIQSIQSVLGIAEPSLMQTFFLGSYEKYHGYILLLTLFGSFFVFSFLSEKKNLIQVSLLTAGLVSLFALLEITGVFRLLPLSGIPSWGDARAISTLGNPNYLAGYLLIHFPLLPFIRRPERYLLFMILFLGILTTKSMIGISLLTLFIFYRFLKPFPYRKIIFLLSMLCFGVVLYLVIPSDKWLSLMSRWVLAKEVMGVIISHPFLFLFGTGPDSLITYFSLPRSELINAYFPKTSSIDSSHNLFLDLVFQYGVLYVGVLIFFLSSFFRRGEGSFQASVLLFLGFFSLNPVVIAPLLPILLILSPDPICSKKK